jgi:putative oxidoreductase
MLKSLQNLNKSYLNPDLGLLILRVGVSFFMAHHGFGKLQNYLNGATDFPDPIGLGAMPSMLLTIFAEFFCSLLLVIGLFTRIAVVPLVICMAVITFIMPEKLEMNSDLEHAALYLVAYLAIFFLGAGKYSVDGKMG